MKGDNKSGRLGEVWCSKYLASHGYEVLYTNFKTKYAEVDIIAREKSTATLCFLEVKTRKSKNYGAGADYIFPSKIKKLILGAKSYLVSNPTDDDIRFDVFEVYGEILPSGFVVSEFNHIKNAFYAD